MSVTLTKAEAEEVLAAAMDLMHLMQHEPGCHYGGVSGLPCDCLLPGAMARWSRASEVLHHQHAAARPLRRGELPTMAADLMPQDGRRPKRQRQQELVRELAKEDGR